MSVIILIFYMIGFILGFKICDMADKKVIDNLNNEIFLLKNMENK